MHVVQGIAGINLSTVSDPAWEASIHIDTCYQIFFISSIKPHFTPYQPKQSLSPSLFCYFPKSWTIHSSSSYDPDVNIQSRWILNVPVLNTAAWLDSSQSGVNHPHVDMWWRSSAGCRTTRQQHHVNVEKVPSLYFQLVPELVHLLLLSGSHVSAETEATQTTSRSTAAIYTMLMSAGEAVSEF